MINKEEFINIFKDSLPKTTIELIGSNIYGPEIPKMVKISPLSMQDEKRILTQDYKNNYYQMILNIVEQGLTTPIDINSLYLFDIDYLFNVIRIQTHGQNVNIEYTCPKCKQKNNINFDLSVVDINKPNSLNDISTNLKLNNVNIKLQIPNVKTHMYVSKLISNNNFISKLKSMAKELKIISPDSITQSTLLDLSLLFTYITEFNNSKVETDEDYMYLMLFILSLKSDQLLNIRDAVLKIRKVFDIKHTYKCINCGNDITLTVSDLGSEYFFPSKLS